MLRTDLLFSAMPLLEGILYGLATTLLIGPVFFTLLKASLDHGVRGGVTVAIGIIASDLLIVLICLSGLSQVAQQWLDGPWMGLVAGVILLVLGLSYLFKRSTDMAQQARMGGRNALGLFTSGFLVNFVNPFVFVIWIGFALHASEAYGTGIGTRLFLSGVLIGIFSTDLLKAMIAPRLRNILVPKGLRRVYIGIGVAMLLFSFRLFVHVCNLWPMVGP